MATGVAAAAMAGTGTRCVVGSTIRVRTSRAHRAMKPCYVGAGALVLLVLSLSLALVQLASALPAPVWGPLFLTGGSGRNIRHLPCVSRRTGESGICMFAYTCMKANGTHLGTCIDRFYFGSCCRVEPSALDSLLPPPETLGENHIEGAGNHPLIDFVNILPPVSSSTSMAPSATSTMKTTSSSTRTTSTMTSTSTMSPFLLSTFQSVQEHDVSTEKPTRTENDELPSTSSARPTTVTPKPSTTTTQVNKPVSLYPSTQKPVKPPVNKPKPSKPASTTRRPATTTRRPAATTRKPVSTSRRPATQRPFTTTTRTTPKLTTRPTTPSTTTTTTTTTPSTPSTASTNLNVSINEVEPTAPLSTESPPSLVTWSWVTEVDARVDVNKTTYATTSKPATFTPSTKPPSIAPPTSSPSTYPPSTKPSTSPPSTKPSTALPSSYQPSTSSSTSPPSTKPSTYPPSTKPSTYPPSTKPSTYPSTKPSTKPSTYPPSTKPSTYPPSTKPSTYPPSTKPSTYPPSPKPSTYPPSTVHTTPTTTASWSKPPSPLTTSPHPQTSPPESSTDGWVQLEISTHSKYNTTTVWFPVAPTTKYPSPPDTQTPTYPSSLWTPSMSSAETNATLSSIITSLTTNATTPMVSSMASSEYPSPSASVTSSMVSSTTEMPPSPSTASSGPAEPPTSSPWTGATPSVQTPTSPPPNAIESGLDVEQLNSLNMSDYKQVCGRRLFPESRIVGGEKASFGKWPWQISLRQWRTSTFLHKCGAALLNDNWAITAAHCVDNVPPTHLMLRLGEHDLSTDSEPYGYKEHRVQLIASHPQFDSRTFEYDLAMLRFYEPVTFQPNIIPICVPDDSTNFVGQTAHVTGWGRIYEEGPLPSVLQEVSVPVINNSVCETMYHAAGYIEHIPNIFICAGWRKGGFDSCEGDSGGPMVIQRPSDKRWILAGVISWGIGCAEPNQPGVYTRISEFRDWINQIIQF